jgi:amphi-Trp domain-containing protein
MKLIDYETKQPLRREDAANELRRLADDLARHNELGFDRDGKHYTVAVADEVVLSVEIEVGKSKSELEIKVKWKAT